MTGRTSPGLFICSDTPAQTNRGILETRLLSVQHGQARVGGRAPLAPRPAYRSTSPIEGARLTMVL